MPGTFRKLDRNARVSYAGINMAKKKLKARLRNFFLLLLFAAIPLTIYVAKQQQDIRQRAQTQAEFILSPDRKTPAKGESMLLAVAVKTTDEPIYAISLNMTYPQDKLDLLKVDTSNTVFLVTDENITGNGLVKISRETNSPRSGNFPIAKLHFKAKDKTSIDEIQVLADSGAITSDGRKLTAAPKIVDQEENSWNPFLWLLKLLGISK